MNLDKKTRRKQQRGIAMIMALLALFVLAVIGMAFMFMTNSETSATRNYKDSQKAYFASRAGLENVRALLWSNAALSAQASGLAMPQTGTNLGVIYVLNSNGADNIDPSGQGPPTGPGSTVATNPTLDDELCHEQYSGLLPAGAGTTLAAGTPGAPCGTGPNEVMTNQNYYQTAPVTAADIPNIGTSSALPFKWIRIANKQNFMALSGLMVDGSNPALATPATKGEQVCWDGQKELAIPPTSTCANFSAVQQVNPVWLLTSLAVTPAGSRRMTVMEVAFTPPLYPPGTISTQAPVNLQGSYSIQSYDNCTCTSTTTGSGKDAVTTYGVSRPGTTCYQQAHVIYTGGGVSVNGGSGTVISNFGSTATTASIQNVTPWPYDTNNLINQYKQSALNASTSAPWSYNCSGTANFSAIPPQYANCGTQTSQGFGTFPPNLLSSNGADNTNSQPATVYVPGSVKLTSDANGAGILIVDGDLEINGGMNYYGLILVRGKVSFTGGGAQTVNIYGSILAGEDVSATDQSVTDDFGGSINFKYDRCALAQSAPPGPPKLLATHEVMY